jgi:hypothetical protein
MQTGCSIICDENVTMVRRLSLALKYQASKLSEEIKKASRFNQIL